MKSFLLVGMAALMLTGCNTLRGTGKDIQVMGETIAGAGQPKAEGDQKEVRPTTYDYRQSATEPYAYGGYRTPDQEAQRAAQEEQRTAMDQEAQRLIQEEQQRTAMDQRYPAREGPGEQRLGWRRLEDIPATPQWRLERATDLMAKNLVSPQGAPLGKIEQIIVDTRRGEVTFAVVAIDRQRYAVPWRAIEMPIRDLRNALILHTGPGEYEPISVQTLTSEGVTQEQRAQPWGQPQAQRRLQQPLRVGLLQQASTVDLIGTNIINRDGENLGQIEDLVLDVNQGRVVYALLSMADKPEQLSAVPFDSIQTEQRVTMRALVPADRQALEDLAFLEGQKPYQDEQFARRVQQQFRERDEYWEVFAFPGGGPPKIDTQNLQTIRGTVESVGTFRDELGEPEGLRLRVRTIDNELVTVHGGPRDFAREQGMTFKHGDEVMVRGAKAQVADREVFVASEISKGETLRLRDQEGQPRWSADPLPPSPQSQPEAQPQP